jgi:hypothetical protein
VPHRTRGTLNNAALPSFDAQPQAPAQLTPSRRLRLGVNQRSRAAFGRSQTVSIFRRICG